MWAFLPNKGRLLDDCQIELNQEVRCPPDTVGLRTNDGLNIFIADDGAYHFSFYERGKFGFGWSGNVDALLYWYCKDVATSQPKKWERAQNVSNTSTRC
jgi:hypothetical protein